MTGRLVKITLVALLAGCTNIDIVRDMDAGLTCEQIGTEMDWVGWEGFFLKIENPFNGMFGSGQIREAEEARQAHLLKIAQEKSCAFVDYVPIRSSTSGASTTS